jgi:hypothetical protein
MSSRSTLVCPGTAHETPISEQPVWASDAQAGDAARASAKENAAANAAKAKRKRKDTMKALRLQRGAIIRENGVFGKPLPPHDGHAPREARAHGVEQQKLPALDAPVIDAGVKIL